VLAFTDVFHFLTHKLARLRTCRFTLAFIFARPLDCPLLWHVNLQYGTN